jgi:general secretion pathway protein E
MVYQIPPSVGTAVTSRIKILGRMDVSEKRRPQDGRLKTRNGNGEEVELRLSTMPTAFGEKLVLRIFDPEVLVKDYHALGFSRSEAEQWSGLISRPSGIILVTGPTGSGKTTTLYTTLKELARPEVNVCTVEDPIELVEPSFNQMQVQHNINLTFASGVRTLLRQDPDIIMIGEIRDKETAEMAVQASLTGHLVFSTLHTNDAPSAITRLLEIGIPPYLLKATLLGVLGQRLTRTLCPHCKEEVPINEAMWETMITPLRAKNRPKSVYQPVGCLECRQTGFFGRVGLYEMMTISPAIKRLMTLDCDLNQLRRQAINDGMRPLRLSGAQKVVKGLTTIEEVLKVAPPESIEI